MSLHWSVDRVNLYFNSFKMYLLYCNANKLICIFLIKCIANDNSLDTVRFLADQIGRTYFRLCNTKDNPGISREYNYSREIPRTTSILRWAPNNWIMFNCSMYKNNVFISQRATGSRNWQCKLRLRPQLFCT